MVDVTGNLGLDEQTEVEQQRIADEEKRTALALEKYHRLRAIHFSDRSDQEKWWVSRFSLSPGRFGSYDIDTLRDIYQTGYEDLVENLAEYTMTYVVGGMGHAAEFVSELGHLNTDIAKVLELLQNTLLDITRRDNGEWF